jgi:hypothetical protein
MKSFKRSYPEKVVWAPYIGERNKICFTDDHFQNLYRTYDFLWNPPFHEPTRKLCMDIHNIRNEILQKDDKFGTSYSEKNYGIYVTSSYYPPGTGWMGEHSDKNEGFPLLHYIVPITHKKLDYEEGGLYVKDEKGQITDIDGQMNPGDVFIYDGIFRHGVAKVKSSKGIGRLQVFAIPTFFEYPYACQRLREEIGMTDFLYSKFKGKAVRIRDSAKRLLSGK